MTAPDDRVTVGFAWPLNEKGEGQHRTVLLSVEDGDAVWCDLGGRWRRYPDAIWRHRFYMPKRLVVLPKGFGQAVPE